MPNWRKKGEGYLPPLPNADSKHRTPTTLLIDLGYSNKRIAERWTWERYQRLCSVLQISEYELASLVLMPHSWVEPFKEHNRIPCSITGGGRAVAMILTILECRVMKKTVNDVIEHVFPNLNKTIGREPKNLPC